MFSMSLRYPKSNSLTSIDSIPAKPADSRMRGRSSQGHGYWARRWCSPRRASSPWSRWCLPDSCCYRTHKGHLSWNRNIISENGVSGQMAILIWIIFLSGFWGTLFADKPISKVCMEIQKHQFDIQWFYHSQTPSDSTHNHQNATWESLSRQRSQAIVNYTVYHSLPLL